MLFGVCSHVYIHITYAHTHWPYAMLQHKKTSFAHKEARQTSPHYNHKEQHIHTHTQHIVHGGSLWITTFTPNCISRIAIKDTYLLLLIGPPSGTAGTQTPRRCRFKTIKNKTPSVKPVNGLSLAFGYNITRKSQWLAAIVFNQRKLCGVIRKGLFFGKLEK